MRIIRPPVNERPMYKICSIKYMSRNDYIIPCLMFSYYLDRTTIKREGLLLYLRLWNGIEITVSNSWFQKIECYEALADLNFYINADSG